MSKVTEFCPHCEEEVLLKDIMFEPQKCPKCGHMIKACILCDWDICDCSVCAKKYPCGEENEAEGEQHDQG